MPADAPTALALQPLAHLAAFLGARLAPAEQLHAAVMLLDQIGAMRAHTPDGAPASLPPELARVAEAAREGAAAVCRTLSTGIVVAGAVRPLPGAS